MARGELRIYLGAAPGVGKTFRMLGEGARRKQRGTDVVVGIVETHGRANTSAQIGALEVLPRRPVAHRGATLEELDVGAILERRPDVVLVDEYAHTNAPGSSNEKRWQDVEQLLAAGIDVIATLNIQHLESLNDVISEITGVVQRETVPDDVVRRADQLELVDMAPEAIRRRLAHGNIYPADRIDAALANYFRLGNLGALRELALLWLADRVEDSLQGYLDAHAIGGTWETRERVVVGLTGRPGGDALIRRASRIAGRVGGELIGVHIAVDDGLSRPVGITDELAAQRTLVGELGGRVHELVAHDAATALVDFARREKATQLVLGASRRTRWQELWRGSLLNRVMRQAAAIDVHVIHDESPNALGADVRRHGPGVVRLLRPDVGPRRLTWSWILTAIGLPAVVAAVLPLREHTAISTVLLLVLTLVLVIAALGGTLVGVVAAVLSSLLVNWFFVPPYNTLTIADLENAIALAVFVGVAVTVGSLVVTASRRAVEAQRARLEARTLASAATTLAADPDPLPELLTLVRTTFGLQGVAIDGIAASGEVTGAALRRVPLSLAQPGVPAAALELFGERIGGDDLRLVESLVDQLSVAIDKRRLAGEAAEAEKLADIDAVRTALLRAVSHDLRTPLASIKAMISGLRDGAVDWRPEQVAEAHSTIEEETDRLTRLVANLLDASRLQIGALAVTLRPTALDAAIAAVVRSIDSEPGGLDLPHVDAHAVVVADAALLERSLDNVVRNALRFSPPGRPVTIDVGRVGDEHHIRVVDHGPGVAPGDRSKVVRPFQRLGDQQTVDGVGLGLAIAQGFVVDAMHGTFTLDDTPGGGLTVTIALPVAAAGIATDGGAGEG